MSEPMLDALDGLPGIALVPGPVEGFGHEAELDNEVVRKVLRLDFAALFPPEAEQGGFVGAHDDPGVRATYKGTSGNMICHSLNSFVI